MKKTGVITDHNSKIGYYAVGIEDQTINIIRSFFDFEKYKVYVEDKEIHMTPIEYKLLVLLVENAGKVLTHSFIIRKIWGYSTTEDSQSLRVFMANIRRKIEKDSAHPRYIITEVGVGYRFVES